MIYVAVAIVLMSVADARITVALVEAGQVAEANPLLAPFVLEPWFAPAKVFFTAIAVLLVLLFMGNSKLLKTAMLVALVVYALVMVLHAVAVEGAVV
jgi:hypothetical protein